MGLVGKNIVRFVGLILLQILLIRNVEFGFLNNYIYLALYTSFLLTFPLNVNKYFVVIVALFLGLSIDMFENTYGLNASACVFMAFVRPSILKRFQTDSPIEDIQELTIYNEDKQKYAIYSFVLIFCYYLWFFLLEEFSIFKIPVILLKTIISTGISTLLILLGQLLLIRKPKTH